MQDPPYRSSYQEMMFLPATRSALACIRNENRNGRIDFADIVALFDKI